MNNRKISIIAMAAIMGVASVGTIAVGFAGGSLTNLVNAEVVASSVTFKRSTGSYYHSSANKCYTTSGTTGLGTTMYLSSHGFAPSSGCVSFFSGSAVAASQNIHISFTSDQEGSTMQRFQSVKSVSIELDTEGSYSFPVVGSTNGSDWYSVGTLSATNYNGSLQLTAAANYIKIENGFSNNEAVDVLSVTVGYSCDTSGEIVPSSSSSSKESTSSEEEPVVSSSSTSAASAAGTYHFELTSYGRTYNCNFILNDEGNSYYQYGYDSVLISAIINWTLAGDQLTVSIKELQNDASMNSFGSYRPTPDESTSNTGALNGNTLSISLYKMNGSSTLRSFTRQ